MREHRGDARRAEREQPRREVERPAVVRRLDEEVARVAGEAEAPQLLQRPVELLERDLAARDEPHDGAGRLPHARKRLLHLLGPSRIVVAHVRRRREHLDPVGRCRTADLEGLIEVHGAVVHTRQHMAVEVDQRFASSRKSSRAASIPFGT